MARTEAEIIEECCVLASSPWLTQHASVYNPGSGLYTEEGEVLVESLALPHQSLINKIPPTDLPTQLSNADFFFSLGPLFPDDPSLCQVDKNKQTKTNNKTNQYNMQI